MVSREIVCPDHTYDNGLSHDQTIPLYTTDYATYLCQQHQHVA